jgi:adenylate cyclase
LNTCYGARMAVGSDFADACVAWATTHASGFDNVPHLLDSYCRFLRSHGIGVRRCNVKTDTIHPQMWAMRYVWFSEHADPGPINPDVIVRRRQYEIGDAFIDEVYFRATGHTSPQYLASPFHRIEQDGELHVAISPAGQAQPYPVFNDLAALGCTEYFGTMLHGFGSAHKLISIAVDNANGLPPAALADMRLSAQVFTLLLNTLLQYEIKNTIACTYIGRDPGQRVCNGMIELGHVAEIEGAIWFSDIRGFTHMSESIPPSELVARLNTYYRGVVGAIYDHGGEVLKFIGDAVLAIFPVQAFGTAESACASAAAAASDTHDPTRKDADGLEDGVALHFGVAQYGNIGAPDRLDFTLIGKEVNIAARAKEIMVQTGAAVVCTRAFKEAANLPMRPLGSFEAKGLRHPVELFTPGAS